jgi:hypothetical protein
MAREWEAAAAMAFISYMVGFALLQVPSRRVRRFADGLIHEAGTVIVFLASIPAIPILVTMAVNVLVQASGGGTVNMNLDQMYTSPTGFFCWLKQGPLIQDLSDKCGQVGALSIHVDIDEAWHVLDTWMSVLNLFSIEPVAGEALISVWSSYMKPAVSVASTIIANTYLLYYVGTVLSRLWWFLIGVGAVLFAIPGRTGRQAGAGLIAVMLVFYVGLPFMPVFVNAFCGVNSPCPPQNPKDLDALDGKIGLSSSTIIAPLQDQMAVITHPDVTFQVTDSHGTNIGPNFISVRNVTDLTMGTDGLNGTGAVWKWVLITLANGTRHYGFLPGDYHVTDITYLNVTRQYTNSSGVSGDVSFTVPKFNVTSLDDMPQVAVNLKLENVWAFNTTYTNPDLADQLKVSSVPVTAFLLKGSATGQTTNYLGVKTVPQTAPNTTDVEVTFKGITITSSSSYNYQTNVTTTTYTGGGHVNVFFLTSTQVAKVGLQSPSDAAVKVSVANKIRQDMGTLTDILTGYSHTVTCYSPTGPPPPCPNNDPSGNSDTTYTIDISLAMGPYPGNEPFPYPGYTYNRDVNPVLDVVAGTTAEVNKEVTSASFALSQISVMLIIRRILIPGLYILLLALIATDVAAFLGGRPILLPGLE